jgi:uncharacterized SAM-binding protein YcdF (DUF218 family)
VAIILNVPRHVDERWVDYLGPGALTSLGLASIAAIGGLGIPLYRRWREVLRVAREDRREAADVILVLGRHLQRDSISDVFRSRLDHARALLTQGLAPRILVAGGLTGSARRSEAEAGREYLLGQGVAAEALLVEDRSRHTLENLFNARETLRQFGWSRLLLVSDALHLARASALARGLSLAVACSPAPGCPPRPGSAGWWLRAAREASLLHWYYVGLAYSRAIRSERLLSRVT